ncbi:MAG: ATPase component of general energizing module of ECF transporters, partial [uncultured Rubrobacteraceae bacterium]
EDRARGSAPRLLAGDALRGRGPERRLVGCSGGGGARRHRGHRLGQEHPRPAPEPVARPDGRKGSRGREGRALHEPFRAPAPRRPRLPVARAGPLRADRRGGRGLRPATARAGRGGGARTGPRYAGVPRGPSPRLPLAVRALGRRETAGRHRRSPRDGPRGPRARRAYGGPRPPRARGSHKPRRKPEGLRYDGRLRLPRPRRGGRGRRPGLRTGGGRGTRCRTARGGLLRRSLVVTRDRAGGRGFERVASLRGDAGALPGDARGARSGNGSGPV